MTYRELPPEEWFRLIGHESLQGADVPTDPENAKCFVAEEDGEMVAVVWLLTQVFMDGFWVKPEKRKSSTGFKLFTRMRQFLDTRPIPMISCFAASPEHAGLLERLGFSPLPLLTLRLPLCPPPLPSPPSRPSPPQDSAI